MKTNSVKKGSEKNIEMFKMSNSELETVSGGQQMIIIDEDGNYVWVWINKSKSEYRSAHNVW